jgi:hypothetical protein
MSMKRKKMTLGLVVVMLFGASYIYSQNIHLTLLVKLHALKEGACGARAGQV